MKGMRRILCFLLICLLLSAGQASAEGLFPLKGAVAAESLEVDRSQYVDASRYPLEPVNVTDVRIGLCYGKEAQAEAQLLNNAKSGFSFGYYDEQRVFHKLDSCSQDNVILSVEDRAGRPSLVVYSAYSWQPLFTQPQDRDSLALVPEDDGPCWFQRELYRGGFEFRLENDYQFTVINCLPLEDYVKGVVAYEMSNDWPMEALRAQAVCARTYAAYNQNLYEDYAFDLTDDTECQVYRGVLRANDRTDEAVESTAGEYVRYKGQLCEIYYFASDGGATEDGANVFGSAHPYLFGKVDPFERAMDYSFSSWEEWRSGVDLSWLLSDKGILIGRVVEVLPEYSSMGNVIAIRFRDEAGNEAHVTGKEAYTFILMNNCRYHVEKEGERFHFTGSGWGHNCGMSQWGARAMASVYDMDYQDIIRFYFTGAYAA